jgi:hypothetical protein
MALISRNTDLKSLRYGKDRVGGGNSNQPYIKSPIPENRNQLDRSGGIDFLLRGGTLTPSRAAEDVSRLTKMFFDFKSPNGVLFTAKQNLLSRTGVKTQAGGFINEGAYLPTSTILQAGGNAFGTHLLKQGINPFRNTSPNAGAINNPLLNLLGVGSAVQGLINNAGGLPVYAQTVRSDQSPDNNRLVQLKNSKIGSDINRNQGGLFGDQTFRQILGQINPFKNKLSSIAKTIFTNKTQKLGISTYGNEILRYGGGPGSILGVGQTAIKRYYFSTTEGFSYDVSKGFFNVLGAGQGIEDRRLGNTGGSTVSDFRSLLDINPNATRQTILSKSPDYTTKNIEQRVNLGDPGRRDKNVSSYTKGLGSKASRDKITAMPLYQRDIADHNPDRNDLVKFSIGIIDNDSPNLRTFIHFRAFLDSMEDNYNAEWNGFKYMGRGENFYRYNGFTRTINLGWTVAAQSKEELIPMYQKLNFLASSLAPDYSAGGYMRGNLAVITVGGYLFDQPGIINSINYSVPQESPWEIGINDTVGYDTSVKELPHIIRVTGFSFTPIHKFVPKLQKNTYDGTYTDKYTLSGVISRFGKGDDAGKERYIALATSPDVKIGERTNNYDSLKVAEGGGYLENYTYGVKQTENVNP